MPAQKVSTAPLCSSVVFGGRISTPWPCVLIVHHRACRRQSPIRYRYLALYLLSACPSWSRGANEFFPLTSVLFHSCCHFKSGHPRLDFCSPTWRTHRGEIVPCRRVLLFPLHIRLTNPTFMIAARQFYDLSIPLYACCLASSTSLLVYLLN